MARVRLGCSRRAGRDDRDRGRDRRAERDRDGGRGRRALRDLPAAPAARADRPRRAPFALPAVRVQGLAAAAGAGRAHRRLRAGRDRPASCAARASSSASRQSGLGQFRVASCRATRHCSSGARACAETIVTRDPQLREPEHALLGDALERAFGSAGARTRSRAVRAAMRVIAGAVRRAAAGGAAGARHPADLRPGARGAVLDARRHHRSARAGPVRGHGRAGDRGAVQGRARRPFSSSATAPRSGRCRRIWRARPADEQAEVRREDAADALRRARERQETYDLVLLDPPYGRVLELGPRLSAVLGAVLAPEARVVLESDRRAPLQLGLGLACERERRYGDTTIRYTVTNERHEQAHSRMSGLV